MANELWSYLHALVSQAWQFYAAVITALVALGESISGKKLLWTRSWWLLLAAVLFLWANFSAWTAEHSEREAEHLARQVAERSLSDEAPRLVGRITGVIDMTSRSTTDEFTFVNVLVSNRGRSGSTANDFKAYIIRRGSVINGHYETPTQKPAIVSDRLYDATGQARSATVIYSLATALAVKVAERSIAPGESRQGALLFRFEGNALKGESLQPKEIHVSFKDINDTIILVPLPVGPSVFPEIPFFKPQAK